MTHPSGPQADSVMPIQYNSDLVYATNIKLVQQCFT